MCTLIDTLKQAPAELPEPADLDLRLYGVINGTLVPCYLWADSPELYNGKHKTTGHNLQVITDQSGNIVFISKSYFGSVHDPTAPRDTRVLSGLDPEHVSADKGYVGSGCDTPYKTVLSEAVGGRGGTVLTMASAKFVMWWNE